MSLKRQGLRRAWLSALPNMEFSHVAVGARHGRPPKPTPTSKTPEARYAKPVLDYEV